MFYRCFHLSILYLVDGRLVGHHNDNDRHQIPLHDNDNEIRYPLSPPLHASTVLKASRIILFIDASLRGLPLLPDQPSIIFLLNRHLL